ncbi:hypothetical protein A2154_00210 [Candidatus Gottesmanbacteria bacterium RBG_16_43_7]|uniref:Uncharacterized protein n=1 Tax=Candidatus Gottesmanbacteria bacterium RBG_16_43_7 TaxID=1798373 RepID=A0A1F5Z982_9BACT|nr:MAG: hypothetical protein A2154_00210 [Candidatus Gottesmanbacteria bacterium RBG_16_43_7]
MIDQFREKYISTETHKRSNNIIYSGCRKFIYRRIKIVTAANPKIRERRTLFVGERTRKKTAINNIKKNPKTTARFSGYIVFTVKPIRLRQKNPANRLIKLTSYFLSRMRILYAY